MENNKKRIIDKIEKEENTPILKDEMNKKRKVEDVSQIQQLLNKSMIDIKITQEYIKIDNLNNKDIIGINKIERKYHEIEKENFSKQEYNNINKLTVKSKTTKKLIHLKTTENDQKDKTKNNLEKIVVGLIITKKTTYKSKNEEDRIDYQSFVISDLRDKNITILFKKDLIKKKIFPGLLVGIKNPKITKSKIGNAFIIQVLNEEDLIIYAKSDQLGFCCWENEKKVACNFPINTKEKKYCVYHLYLKCEELRSHRMELNSEFIGSKTCVKWSNLSCGSFLTEKEMMVSVSDEGRITKQTKYVKEKKKELKSEENRKDLNIILPEKKTEIQNAINLTRSTSRGAKLLSNILNNNNDDSKSKSSFVMGNVIDKRTANMLRRSSKKRTFHPNSSISFSENVPPKNQQTPLNKLVVEKSNPSLVVNPLVVQSENDTI